MSERTFFVEEHRNLFTKEIKLINLHLSASGYSPEGIPVGVMLHIRNGLLSELEAYSEDGTKVFGLPDTEKLNAL
jgi:hypothetical protein